ASNLRSNRRLRCQASLRSPARAGRPFFQRPFSCKVTESRIPNLAKESNSQVGSSEVLSGPVGNPSLSYLRDVVLRVHVRDSAFRRAPEILKTNLARQNGISEFSR